MTYHYVDTETGEDADPTSHTYSVMALAKEHQIRYVFKSADGAIILRHLPLRMKRVIDSVMAMIFPSSDALRKRIAELAEGIRDVPEDDIPDEIKSEFIKASAEYRCIAQYYALGVIEEPRCCTMDDVDEIYARLTPTERDALDMLIQELVRIKEPHEVDDTALTIADRYKVEIIDREMLDNLTVSQASYFLKVIERENKDIARMMKR